MTGGELLLDCLQAQRVRAVFGMPGTQNLALYDAFHGAGRAIKHYLVRNEQAATLIAGGFARATGDVGVALTVPGPGASNAATGIADAHTDCQPVLLITGGVDRPMQHRDRSKMFHGLDQAAFFRPIVRRYDCPQSAAQIPQSVRAAFGAVWAGRPGPAVLEIPPDVAAEQVTPSPIPQPIDAHFERVPSADAVQSVVTHLRRATRPAIIVGGDAIASGSTASLDRLARQLGAPVIETRLGKGALPTSHPLNLGNARHKRAKAVLAAADLLLAIGVRFSQIDSSNWHMRIPPCLIQIDRDPAEIGREFPVTDGLVGDLTPTMELLGHGIGPSNPATDWRDTLAEIQSSHRRAPVPVLSDIRAALPRNGILAADITSLSYRGFDEYPVEGPRSFLYSCHYVTMGSGLPFAIGAKIGCPNQPVVALCGDGGLVMSIGELATIAQYQIGVVIVVVVDRSLVAIKASQVKQYEGRLIDTDLPGPDFVALAKSFGIAGFHANDLPQLRSLIASALSSDKPALIEVPMVERETEIMNQIPWLAGE